MIHYMYCIITYSYAIQTSVICAVAPLIAVTEVVLVTSSDKKEIQGKYCRKLLTVRLRGRQRPKATRREKCKAWMETSIEVVMYGHVMVGQNGTIQISVAVRES